MTSAQSGLVLGLFREGSVRVFYQGSQRLAELANEKAPAFVHKNTNILRECPDSLVEYWIEVPHGTRGCPFPYRVNPFEITRENV